MHENEKRFVQGIRGDYEEKAQTPLDELIALDKKAKRPAQIISLVFGIVAALVMGVGMCLAMKVIFASHAWVMPIGIAVGLVGIALAGANYFLFKRLEQRGKDKYSERILSITSKLLGE